MKELINYLENHTAWCRGYLKYNHWYNVICFVYKIPPHISQYDGKKLFNTSLQQNLFYTKKIKHRYYYKYKSKNEITKNPFIVEFL